MDNIKQIWEVAGQLLRTRLTIPEIKISGYNVLTVYAMYVIWDNRQSFMFQTAFGAVKGAYTWILNIMPF